MDDEKIIALFGNRSEMAIAQTDARYGPLCRGIAGKLLQSPEDVEECINDAYHALWNSIPPARPSSLGAYIAGITRNLAMKRLEYISAEKRSLVVRESLEELDDCVPATIGPEQIYEEKALKEAIIRFLQRQKQLHRVLFLRRYFFFDSIKEIKENYGLSESKVKSSLMRTRNKLKVFLIEEGYDL